MKPIIAAMLSCESVKLSDREKRLFSQYNPMGITVFKRNVEDAEQLSSLILEVKEVIGRDDVLIAIDQEGGRVRRLGEDMGFRSYSSQSAIGSLDGENADLAAKYHAQLIGDDLIGLGVNWNFAPVLDVSFEGTTEALKDRCFGDDKEVVARLGKIMVDEYVKMGICPCIKHMPGHGRAVVDPHLHLPILDNSLKELEKDFYPFHVSKNAPAGMTAHIVIPEVDDKLPITQSKKAIDKVIRGMMGFDGFLISDAIDMKALSGTIGEKTKTSLDAGCDGVCYCFGIYEEMLDLCNNCSVLEGESLKRFERISKIIANPQRLENVNSISNNYNKLMKNIGKYESNYDATEILHRMKENKNK